jgi:TRAP-type transport system small permease protein
MNINMNRKFDPVYKFFVAGTIISLGAMIAVVGIQVFFRYFVDFTPHWTEELARVFFIYSVAFGTGTGIRNGDFIRLDLVSRYLSPSSDRLLKILTDVAIIIFSIIMAIYSIQFARSGFVEKSPALEITMGFVFISMVILSLGITIFTLEHLVGLVRRNSN